MSTLTTANEQSKIPKDLVEQVIYIIQNHTLAESAINNKIEKLVQETIKRSTNPDSVLTRQEFLTAMQSMDKRFEDQNKYLEKRFEDQNKYLEKRFEEQKEYSEKRFKEQKEYSEKRFEDQKQYMDKRFNALQWTIGIGFTIFSSLMIAMMGFLQNILR